ISLPHSPGATSRNAAIGNIFDQFKLNGSPIEHAYAGCHPFQAARRCSTQRGLNVYYSALALENRLADLRGRPRDLGAGALAIAAGCIAAPLLSHLSVGPNFVFERLNWPR